MSTGAKRPDNCISGQEILRIVIVVFTISLLNALCVLLAFSSVGGFPDFKNGIYLFYLGFFPTLAGMIIVALPAHFLHARKNNIKFSSYFYSAIVASFIVPFVLLLKSKDITFIFISLFLFISFLLASGTAAFSFWSMAVSRKRSVILAACMAQFAVIFLSFFILFSGMSGIAEPD
ncbi:MAG: hypothetical protein IT558_04995 [Alphaproteobacteria bacterium]|nr:hypothetical protein [Alphaproteobacteria bacterium]